MVVWPIAPTVLVTPSIAEPAPPKTGQRPPLMGGRRPVLRLFVLSVLVIVCAALVTHLGRVAVQMLVLLPELFP